MTPRSRKITSCRCLALRCFVLSRALELPESHGLVFPNQASDDAPPPRTARLGGRCSAPGSRVPPHWLRSTFHTWPQERGENWEAAEISLIHQVGGSAVASYARSGMLDMRWDLTKQYARGLDV